MSSDKITPLMYGDQSMLETIRDMKADIAWLKTRNPRINNLSQLSSSMGLLDRGEFRSGTGTPGIDFTGTRIGRDVELETGYAIATYNVNVLQFGINTSGQATWGAGAGVLDASGMRVAQGTSGPNKIIWPDDSDNDTFEIFANVTGVAAKGNIHLHPASEGEGGVHEIEISVSDGAASPTYNKVNITEVETIFNSGGANIDMKVLDSSSGTLAFFDASAGRLGIGTASPSNTLHVSGNTFLDGRVRLGKSTVTISTGTIAYVDGYHIVAAESGTADNLDQITGGGAGAICVLKADSGDTITVRDAVNNIYLASGANKVLSGNATLSLINDTGSAWIQTAFGNNP